MESEQQRRLAHFLEHMAFNATTHYPVAGEMDEYFQRLGTEPNASTSFDHTIYELELPQNNAEFIRDGLQLFRDRRQLFLEVRIASK
jgi:zinc protease